MPTNEQIIEALRAKRAEYEREFEAHKLLMDGYLGSGGFMSRARQEPSGWWGAAAEIYSRQLAPLFGPVDEEARIDTYLDRFPREDIKKFERRVRVAYYPNYVEPCVDIKLSYLFRKPFDYQVPEQTKEWMEDCDGLGTPWEHLRREVIAKRAAVLGWCPVLFDMPRVPEGVSTRAQADELGIKVRAIPLLPANVYDYECDDEGQLLWLKMCTHHRVRGDWNAPVVHEERFTIWYRNIWRRFTVRTKIEGGQRGTPTLEQEDTGPNEFKKVPIVFFRHAPIPQDRIKGVSMVQSVVQLARRLFNLNSELDEHIRSTVFAMLVVPTKAPDKVGELLSGSGQGLPIDPDFARGYEWLAPPGEVAATLETRITNITEDIHTLGKIETARGTPTTAASGVSRAYEFENMNRAIADFAGQLAHDEEDGLELVAIVNGGDTDDDATKVTPPTRFEVEEMAREIDDAINAITLNLGKTANREMKRRLVRKLLPNLAQDELDAIDKELEELEKAREQEAQAMREEREAAVKAKNEGKDLDEEDEDDEEEAA